MYEKLTKCAAKYYCSLNSKGSLSLCNSCPLVKLISRFDTFASDAIPKSLFARPTVAETKINKIKQRRKG